MADSRRGPTGGGKGKAKKGGQFYARVLSQEEIAALAELAANHPSLQDEIALLKVLIRRKLEEGTDLPTISRAIDALGRALKVQKQISDEGHQELRAAFIKALVEMGQEEGGRGPEKAGEGGRGRKKAERATEGRERG